MGNIRTAATRAAGALLVSFAIFGCDSANRIAAPEVAQDGRAGQLGTLEIGEMIRPAQEQVEIYAVFSGPPNRDPNQISLDDPSVFVQILDIEQYLGRSASASDVRIGDDWETGTPAENFEILDINDDGDRDIQLRFDTQQLIDDGHLDENTTEITVWGRDPTSGNLYTGTATVEVIGGPGGEPRTLTTAPANNGSGGIFMDLTPTRLVHVTSFESPFTGTVGTTVDVQVWTRDGSYVGFDGDPTGWTLRETVTVTRQGTTVNAMIDLQNPIALQAGETTAVYLQATATGGLRYTGTGANPPQTTWSNDDLTLFSDVARVATEAFAGTRFSPRTFSGNVNYLVFP